MSTIVLEILLMMNRVDIASKVSNNIIGFTVDESSIIALHEVAGKEGGSVQYLGSEPKTVVLRAKLVGVRAKQGLDHFAIGAAYNLFLSKHGQTWYDGEVRLVGKASANEAGTPSEAGGEAVYLDLLLREEQTQGGLATLFSTALADEFEEDALTITSTLGSALADEYGLTLTLSSTNSLALADEYGLTLSLSSVPSLALASEESNVLAITSVYGLSVA